MYSQTCHSEPSQLKCHIVTTSVVLLNNNLSQEALSLIRPHFMFSEWFPMKLYIRKQNTKLLEHNI